MWNANKSLTLSKCCTVLFMLLLIACVIFAPRLARNWLDYMPRERLTIFLATLYIGSIPAAALLVLLYVLLHRIGSGRVFMHENVACLRHISWCCIIGAAIAAASSFYWIPWLAVAAAGAFMGLIVRVVKNVFAKAIDLQDDAELTI